MCYGDISIGMKGDKEEVLFKFCGRWEDFCLKVIFILSFEEDVGIGAG